MELALHRVRIGVVVPVYQTRFINNVISLLKTLLDRTDFILCIVNDGGEQVAQYLRSKTIPSNAVVFNLHKNCGFATANNEGWKYLLSNYPSIKFLGSLNDDTMPHKGWIDALLKPLESKTNVGLTMPIMEQRSRWLKRKKLYAVWKLKNPSTMEPFLMNALSSDMPTSALNGFCFLAKKDVLAELNFFDDHYLNGCEDLDLGIRILQAGYTMLVCKDAFVFHYGAGSRYLGGTVTNIDHNHKYLTEKYGCNIEQFNIY